MYSVWREWVCFMALLFRSNICFNRFIGALSCTVLRTYLRHFDSVMDAYIAVGAWHLVLLHSRPVQARPGTLVGPKYCICMYLCSSGYVRSTVCIYTAWGNVNPRHFPAVVVRASTGDRYGCIVVVVR